jgi:hypothetical protein
MEKSILKRRLFALYIFFSSMLAINVSIAAVPAPPVNQDQGVPDHAFNTMSEPVCRACHNQNPPAGIPINPTYLPHRHHLKVGVSIPPKTDILFPDGDDDGIPDTTYTCTNCHKIEFDPVTHIPEINILRDCMQCHVYGPEGSVHHRSDKTIQLDCKACHGGLVNNHPTEGANPDGHYIPTYSPSQVTPWPSGKPNGNGNQPPSSAGTYPGNCDYCHNTEDGTPNGGAPVQTSIGMLTIDTSEHTHHTAAIGSLQLPGQPPCMVCHDFTSPSEYRIRTCENCHGIDTLHAISADTNGNGFQLLREAPGYSHVGSLLDCWGCHDSNARALADKLSAKALPSIDFMDGSAISAGADSSLTIGGTNFTGYEKNPWTGANDALVSSVVRLIDSKGNETELVPNSVTETSIQVTVPGTMAPDNYRVVVDKKGSESNPASMIIKPEVAIDSAVCRGKNLSVTGRGFGDYSSASNSGTSVSVAGESGRVISWSDQEIRAQAVGCGSGETVSVSGIHGSISAIVE